MKAGTAPSEAAPLRDGSRPSLLVLGAGWFPDQPGGLNRYVRELLGALEASASPRAVVVGPAADARTFVDAPARHDDALPLRLWRYSRAARRAAAGTDVVDAHFALYAFLPVVLGRLRRIPLVVHFQGPWAEESLAVGDDATWKIRAKRLVERAVYRRARELVVLSGAFKRILVERYGVRPWRVHVIPPGVNLLRFTPGDRGQARTRLGIPEEARLAFAARRLVPRMGLDVLLDAWGKLRSESAATGHQALLVVAGDGPSRGLLERRAVSLGIADTVRFVGRVADETLVDYYRAADVSVVPSVALEGFGLVVLEALACGTPVIVTDAGGLPETLATLDPTLVVPAGDASALAVRLHAVLENRAASPSRERCRAHAEAFSWDAATRRNLDVYARATGGSTAKRNRKLRVVYLDHCARLAGGELALLRLLPALTDVEAHVILAEEGPLVTRLTRAGISVEVLRMAEAARGTTREHVDVRLSALQSGLGSLAYALRLSRRLRRLRPDIVHTNSLKAALYGGLAGRIARVPVVWHVRDRVAEDYLPAPAVRLVRAAASRLPAAIIGNSRTTLACLGGAGALGWVIPSPVVGADDHGEMDRQRSGNPFTAGILGRLAPWKGQHVFLEAFARAFPTGAERAVVIGSPLFGEDRYAAELHELAATLGLNGRATFTGFRDDVPAELARLDALVHASVIPEPFGLAVVEGLAVGLPVIAAAAGGPAEVIEDGVSGMLYPPGDVDALAAALTTLATDRGARARLGAAGRREARRFAPEVVAAETMQVYRAISPGRSVAAPSPT